MNAEPKPYVLPQLRDIGSGAGWGVVEGMLAGLWSAPASIGIGFLWICVTSPGPAVDLWRGFPFIANYAIMAAFLGCCVGGILGGMAGGSIYMVLYPFLSSNRWPRIEPALRTGFKWGTIGGQIVAAVVPIGAFTPLARYVSVWMDSDILFFLWFAIVPCGFVVGGFINVARLLLPDDSGAEDHD